MLRMGTFPEYSDISLIKEEQMYRIAPFDNVSFTILPNDGESQISAGVQGQGSGNSYIVEFDGTIKLPIFGRTPVEGMTIRELEKMLEEKYALMFNKPFVLRLTVTNKKVFVFRNNNRSSVVNLSHEKMNIWELVAQTGGVADAKAHRIKLIRQIDGVPHVFLIDLSRLESMNTGNIVLQANDIVYMTPRNKFSEEIMFAVSPYLSLLTTGILIYTLIKR